MFLIHVILSDVLATDIFSQLWHAFPLVVLQKKAFNFDKLSFVNFGS